MTRQFLALCGLLCGLAFAAANAQPITFQGQLRTNGVPANGAYDIEFQLRDANFAIQTIMMNGVQVTNGLFTANLNFNATHWNGEDRFIRVRVREAGGGLLTSLVPEVQVRHVPYAHFALNVPNNSITTAKIQDNAVNTAKIDNGAVTLDKLAGNSVNGARIVNNSITDVDINNVSWNKLIDVPIDIANGDNGLALPFFGESGVGQDLFTVLNWGNFDTAVFRINNAGSFGQALQVNSNGAGSASEFWNTGTSRAARFVAESGVETIWVDNNGTGRAARLESSNASTSTLRVTNWGETSPNAAIFDGDVDVNGTLSKSAGTFKIDHPLDPENKYLVHSFVESPDMMNIYNGNIRTDDKGFATVVLPAWFETLNRDFRYQLTVLDDSEDFVLAKVVSQVKGNEFRIRTSKPNVMVSWQVTGVRQDPYAEMNRIQPEVDKDPEHRGFFLFPEGYGQPRERSILFAPSPERTAETEK